MAKMIYEQGDIVSINFDPSAGHEPAHRHFAVVISPYQVNRMSSLTVVVPITSRDNGYPFHVKVTGCDEVAGFAQCEALRAMDLGFRELGGSAEWVGVADDKSVARILATIKVVTGTED